jgi:hypothetical protein
MQKQINFTIKAHLIQGAFYLLLLVTVCAIPFVLAQPGVRGTTDRGVAKSGASLPQLTSAKDMLAQLPASERPVPLPHPKGIKGNATIAKLIGRVPLFTYMIDDGTAEDAVGLIAGGSFVVCNSFPGNNVITSISIAWGTPAFPNPTLNGLPYTAVLWSDPNGDGSPTDAVVLAMAPGVIAQEGTNTFITTAIPPTTVTTANFFVGFLITSTANQLPAAVDETAPSFSNRSWIALTSDINDLSGAFTIESAGVVSNWLIRADSPTPPAHPSFFNGEIALGSGVYYLQFPNGTPFGYYSYLTDPYWIYHFDMGYEYWFDANDGQSGIYFYDNTSTHFFYTSPSFPFPYLYDFTLNTVLYYYPDTNNPGHYTTNPRYFYNFATGQIITM